MESRESADLGADVFGALLQTPDEAGLVHDFSGFVKRARQAGVLVAVASDLLALTLLRPPGEWGADVVVGNSQRFGVPLGYGGPHAAFFATRQAYVRQTPGRIIGASVDAHGHTAYRMALQTREQHIRREKATSNICTAEALLANLAAFYAVYHGPDGLAAIARRIRSLAAGLVRDLAAVGVRQLNDACFDTLRLAVPDGQAAVGRIREAALGAGINFRYRDDGTINIALDETTDERDIASIARVFGASGAARAAEAPDYPPALARTSAYLTHPVFSAHRSETHMMRFLKSLERKDIGLDTSMIPLGSCTMKLNAAAAMMPVTWSSFSKLHPFAPVEQAAGYQQILRELESALCTITGFAAVSLQPNSGAQGEFAGLMVIRAYHRDRGDADRDVVLIPASAHGTNPASSVMAGMRAVIVASRPDGSIDLDDLQAKAAAHAGRLAALMVTYPSTHGVFEDGIQEVCAVVHQHGGQVYMDGANMNAQVGLTSPAIIGADVCHLNLHKTFSIPHGGGGPGMGPIAVAAHLAPYLPGHPLVRTGGAKPIHAVSAAPWSSASILLISYGYIRMLGGDGMTDATRFAILNANYIKARLERHFPVLYTRPNGRVAHELIFDLRPLGKRAAEYRRDRRRQTAHGLRLSRPYRVIPRAGHAHGRADRERVERRARQILRRDDRDSRGNTGRHRRDSRPRRQRAGERAAHRRGSHGGRLGPSLFARAGGVSAPVRPCAQVLAERGPHRQPLRRPKPHVLVPADLGLRVRLAAVRRPAGQAAAAPCALAMYALRRAFVTGPGIPLPITCASTFVAGTTPRVVLVKKTSSAFSMSSSRRTASRTGMPASAPISNRNARVMPGSRPASSGGVNAAPSFTTNRFDCVHSASSPR